MFDWTESEQLLVSKLETILDRTSDLLGDKLDDYYFTDMMDEIVKSLR